jgi:RHS repeat-associated protein
MTQQTLGYGNPIEVSQSTNPTTAASLTARFSKVHKQSFTPAGRKQTRTDPDGNGSNKSHSFTYDAAGRLATVALPPIAQNVAVGTTSGSITISQYRWNQPSEITYPNGLKQTTTHDALMRPTNIQVAPVTNPTAANTPMNFGYVFDEVSNINQITRQGRDTNYSYDTLYRLTEALPAPATAVTANPASGASLPTERYSYDLVHNRLTENRSGGEALTANNSNAATATATPSLTDITATYSYNANHQITEIRNSALPNTAPASLIQSFSYSADGHTTAIATNAQIANNIQLPERPESRSFVYDAQERLIQVSDGGNIVAMLIAQYRYDPFGRRILKTLTQAGADNANTPQAKLLASGANTPNVNPGSTYYGYTDEGLVAEYASQNSATPSTPATNNGDMLAAYGYLPNQTWQTNPAYKRDTPFVVSLSNPSNTSTADRIHLFHNDHLGSPQRLTDAEGKTSWAASFESFGRGYADASAGATSGLTVNSTTPTANNHRFPGQLLDAETGLAQNYHRDYFSMFGRYLEGDPIGLNGGLNLFGYVRSSPIWSLDPIGWVVYRSRPGDYSDTPPSGACEEAIWAGGFIMGWKPCGDDLPGTCGENGSGSGGRGGGRGGRGGYPGSPGSGPNAGGGGSPPPPSEPPPPPFWPCAGKATIFFAGEYIGLSVAEHWAEKKWPRFHGPIRGIGGIGHLVGAGNWGWSVGGCINSSFLR